MAIAVVANIETHYEEIGAGPPLLMFSPGGFDAQLANWRSHGLYSRTRMLHQLAERYRCIIFDRRESGLSGGRVERITWDALVAQGIGLLDHLGIRRAHLMGACVGCSVAAAFAVAHPERVRAIVLYSPAGGPRYRMMQHSRFAAHTAYVAEYGPAAVVELARTTSASFSLDGRVGPWATLLARDDSFARAYAAWPTQTYLTMVAGLSRLMFDRDTVPGVEPEDLLGLDIPALIVPGQDASHALSAARYLQECLPRSEYWDVPLSAQGPDTAPARVLKFLEDL